MPAVSAPDAPAQQHDLRVDQAASDDLDAGDPATDCDQDQHMAALELVRHLRVNDEVAWRINRKVMQVMAEREAPRPLSGFVQVDDAYLGGECNGDKSGCGSENK